MAKDLIHIELDGEQYPLFHGIMERQLEKELDGIQNFFFFKYSSTSVVAVMVLF